MNTLTLETERLILRKFRRIATENFEKLMELQRAYKGIRRRTAGCAVI